MIENAVENAIHDALMRGERRANLVDAIRVAARQDRVEPPTDVEIDAAYPRVIDRWMDAANESDALFFARLFASLDDLYQRSHQLGDYKTCAAVLRDKVKAKAAYSDSVAEPRKLPARQERIARLRDRRPDLKAV